MKKTAKKSLLALTCAAMLMSFGVLIAEPGGGEAGDETGTGIWSVTCDYDGMGVLQKQTCTTGGIYNCGCA